VLFFCPASAGGWNRVARVAACGRSGADGTAICPEGGGACRLYRGVAGPVIGADLLHLKEIEQSAVGIASIGGAGTFDGIVLSGIVAAYLA